MKLKDVQRLELPATADMHVHLRQDQVIHSPLARTGLDWTNILLNPVGHGIGGSSNP